MDMEGRGPRSRLRALGRRAATWALAGALLTPMPALGAACGQPEGAGSSRSGSAASTPDRPQARSCCKICTTGKACGDTCISRSNTCRKGPGCACDAQ